MSPSDSKVIDIQTHFQNLTTAAGSLNVASDELTKAVAVLDEALKKLNIGLSTWVNFSTWEDGPKYWQDRLGYTKVNGKWGIAILSARGDETCDVEEETEGPWLFNDAPRQLRLLSVDKLPELIEKLGKDAADTTKEVKEKTKRVRELTTAITQIAQSPKPKATHLINLSSEEIQAIIAGVEHTQKFVGELLHRADQWEHKGDELHIWFSKEKSALADLLEGRETLAKVSSAVNNVLGTPLIVKVHTAGELASPSTVKGGK
jgi:hypothetical protein